MRTRAPLVHTSSSSSSRFSRPFYRALHDTYTCAMLRAPAAAARSYNWFRQERVTVFHTPPSRILTVYMYAHHDVNCMYTCNACARAFCSALSGWGRRNGVYIRAGLNDLWCSQMWNCCGERWRGMSVFPCRRVEWKSISLIGSRNWLKL